MKTPALRAHYLASDEHVLALDSRLDGIDLVRWHDREHQSFSGPLAHAHDTELRLEILEVKIEAVETRLSGVIETHHLWDGS